MTQSQKVWQVSGGPANRSYADDFMRHGVALIGPGDAGPWQPSRPDDDFGGGFVRRFAVDVRLGDIVLLRSGNSAICAVGLVASEYLYLPQFDDVNGWDLQHGRRVRWFQLLEEYDFGAPVFGGSSSRFGQVAHPVVVDYAIRFVQSPPTYWQRAALPPLPPEQPLLLDVPLSLRPLVAQTHDLAGLYWDRRAFGDHPAEDEMIVHFVVPLLQALGWPVELIAVKWRFIDVSVFRALPRIAETCHLVIEAKRLGQGVEGALEQALGYVYTLGKPVDVVVTDGIRYRLYAADRSFAPVAYANLARLKQPSLDLFERLRRP